MADIFAVNCHMDDSACTVAFLRSDTYMSHEIQVAGGYIVAVDICENAGSGNFGYI